MRDKETYTWNAVANYRTATVQSRDCEVEADPQKSKAKTTRTRTIATPSTYWLKGSAFVCT